MAPRACAARPPMLRRLLVLLALLAAGAGTDPAPLDEIVAELARITSALQRNSCPADFSVLVDKFGLKKTPGGTYFKVMFTSESLVDGVPATNTILELQPAATLIPWLHTNATSQLFVWHHRGAALAVHSISEAGQYQRLVLGDPLRHADAHYQLVLPTGGWIATEVLSDTEYVLLSGSAVPAFDRLDYELAELSRLTEQHPRHAELIRNVVSRR